MRKARHRITEAADEDIERILRESARLFGSFQQLRYEQIIETAIEMIVDDPERLGSRDRADLGTGVRSFHLELAAKRLGSAAHILIYSRSTLDDGSEGIAILRVLHEGMDPTRHFKRGLE